MIYRVTSRVRRWTWGHGHAVPARGTRSRTTICRGARCHGVGPQVPRNMTTGRAHGRSEDERKHVLALRGVAVDLLAIVAAREDGAARQVREVAAMNHPNDRMPRHQCHTEPVHHLAAVVRRSDEAKEPSLW